MNHYRSDTIANLMTALAKAQGSYKDLIPNEDAAGGKFANLQAILAATREALSLNGLAFYQYIDLLDQGAGASLLRTQLCHASGEYVSSCARIVQCETFRETFNCVESYRRMNALLILGIAPSPFDPIIRDDNGVEEQDASISKSLRKPEKQRAAQFGDKITKAQYDSLMIEVEGLDEILVGVQEAYSVKTLADLPQQFFIEVQTRIRKIKKTHDEFVRK